MTPRHSCLMALVLMCGCTNTTTRTVTSLQAIDEKSRIEVLAFQWLMRHDESTGISQKYAVILCINKSDPPQSIFGAISPLHKNVLPCTTRVDYAKGNGELRVGGDPAKAAIMLSLSDITVNANEVRVGASYFEASQSAAWYTIVLRKTDGIWQIVNVYMNGIA